MKPIRYATTSTGVSIDWTVFKPPGAGRHPVTLVLHPGGFKTGNAGPPNVCQDLAAAGIIALATEYRLAPPHSEMNTPGHPAPAQNTVVPIDDGHFPAQTDDVRAAIRAARALPLCDGRVFCLGGSAGASHSLWWAALGLTGDDAPDLAVLCSGPYELDNIGHLQVDYPPGETNFHDAVMNYIGRPDGFPSYTAEDLAALRDASPLTWIHNQMCPLFAMVSSDDAGGVDTFDFPRLLTRLQEVGAVESTLTTPAGFGTYKQAIVPVSVQTHAFKYWDLVKNDVITWLLG